MQRQFFSGNSIEQAVMAAARHYKIDPERVAYKQREKKHGFLNVRKRIVIEVDPEAPELTDEQIAARQAPTGPERKESRPARKREETRRDPEVAEEEEDLVSEEEEDDFEEEDFDDEDDDDEDSDDDEDDDEDSDDDEDDDEDSDDDVEEEDRPQSNSRGASGDGGRNRGPRGKGRGGRGNDSRDHRGRASQGRGGERGGSDRGGRGGGRRSGRDRSHGRRDSSRRRPVKVLEYEWMGIDWDEDDYRDEVERELAAYEISLEQVLDVMDLDIEYTIEAGEVVEIDFEGEDSELLLEDDGKVLKAIEHILPRMARSLVEKPSPCKTDCEDFRAGHEKRLQDMAQNAAESALDSGRKKLLPPMNPADRRIVHLALVDRPDVDTLSEGHGYMKRVKVIPLDESDFDGDYDDEE